MDDVRYWLSYLDPSLGKPLPERSYAEDCRIYTPNDPISTFRNIRVNVCSYLISFTCRIVFMTSSSQLTFWDGLERQFFFVIIGSVGLLASLSKFWKSRWNIFFQTLQNVGGMRMFSMFLFATASVFGSVCSCVENLK